MNVHMTRCSGYHDNLSVKIPELLENSGCRPLPGTRVLVKPNLIGRRNARLACTRAEVVLAGCAYLLDCGAEVEIRDSPAFGSVAGAARSAGIAEPAARMGIPVAPMDHPRPVPLSFGGHIGISARALDTDLIVNMPKLKAHSQMRITGAVKNFFGTVTGFRKAWAHTLHGDKGNRFESVLVETMLALPPSFCLMDGIECMHVRGPLDGEPYALGLLAASQSSTAADTAVYSILGLQPEAVPLWTECMRRGMEDTRLDRLNFPMLKPADFNGTDFRPPKHLKPMTFHPVRLIRGRLKSFIQTVGQRFEK